jgi:hypothetical protein
METKILANDYLQLHANGEMKLQDAAVTGYCNEKPIDLFERREIIVMLH